jgi:hypothetical protein
VLARKIGVRRRIRANLGRVREHSSEIRKRTKSQIQRPNRRKMKIRGGRLYRVIAK